MIGKKMRGFRHLMRNAEITNGIKLLSIRGNNIDICHALKSNHRLYIFNNFGGDRCGGGDYDVSNPETARFVNSMCRTYGRELRICDQGLLCDYGLSFILLPEDFDESFEKFANSNKKLLEPVFKRFGDRNHPFLMLLYAYSSESPNLFLWAATNVFKHGADIAMIKNILVWNENYGKLANKLKKGTITAYNGFPNLFVLEKELAEIRTNKRSNDVINTFNTQQKKILKAMTLGDKEIGVISKFGTLSTPKKINFIQKVSSIEDGHEILRQMGVLCNVHFEWSRDSFLDYVKNADNIKCDIVWDKDNVILAKVYTYDTIKYLGKSTNWCISKNKSYWNQYIEQRKNNSQYVIFNFNLQEDEELSIVGFTVNDSQGITNAHSFTNNNLMEGRSSNSIDSWYQNLSNIYSILSSLEIPMETLLRVKSAPYKWNIDSFLDFIRDVVGDENISCLQAKDNKYVFAITSKYVPRLFGKRYEGAFEMGYEGTEKHLFFLDFNKSETDINRILFGIVTKNKHTQEESCSTIFNSMVRNSGKNLDSLLLEFDLPYDIICRPNDNISRFYSALSTSNCAIVKTFLTDDTLVAKILEADGLVDTPLNLHISNSIFANKSFKLIDTIYESNHTLCELIGVSNTYAIVNSLLSEIIQLNGRRGNVPSKSELEAFTRSTLTPAQKILFVGYFLTLRRILEHETSSDFFNKVARHINACFGGKKSVGEYVLKNIYTKINYGQFNDGIYSLIMCAKSTLDEEVFAHIVKSNPCEDTIAFMNSQLSGTRLESIVKVATVE